jgi:hypothetical protein
MATPPKIAPTLALPRKRGREANNPLPCKRKRRADNFLPRKCEREDRGFRLLSWGVKMRVRTERVIE